MPLISLVSLVQRVEERYFTLAAAAEQLLNHDIVNDGQPRELVLDDVALLRATEAYFLVSEAYKQQYGIDTTEPPKVAAITALVLTDFRPLRLIDTSNVRNPYAIYANELLSLSWAAAPLGHDLAQLLSTKLRRDGIYRYLRTLKSQRLRCLDEFKANSAKQPVTFQDWYDIKLDHDTPLARSELSDLPTIENFVLIFDLMWDGKTRSAD